MQDRPDKTQLLDAITQFLTAEVQPAIAATGDARLAFRCLIAANLAAITAAEIRTQDRDFEREFLRLTALFPDVAGTLPSRYADRQARRHIIQKLNVEAINHIRTRGIRDDKGQAIWAHVRQTLIEKLAVANPQFDISPRIE